LIAARFNKKIVSEKDFEYAKDKILMGPERKSAVLPKETIRMTAFHEAGHALVSYYLSSKEDVHKITVIPRGQALGLTAYLPKEDIFSHSKDDLMTKIAFAMGGRAAEEIKFAQFTTGASNDIQQATDIARRMVCQFGMSRLGPINFGQKSENPFLGRDWGESRNYSESIAHEIDVEVLKIINTQYDLAKQILVDHMDVFDRVSQILLEVETLDSEEFLEIVTNNASVETIREMQNKKASMGKNGDKDDTSKDAKPQAPFNSQLGAIASSPA
jgi:cell division protease FtsH